MCKIPGMSGKQARLQQIADANDAAAATAKQSAVTSQQSNDGSVGAQVAPGVTVLGQTDTLEGRFAGIGTRNVRLAKSENVGRQNSSDPATGGGVGSDKKKKRVSAGLGL